MKKRWIVLYVVLVTVVWVSKSYDFREIQMKICNVLNVPDPNAEATAVIEIYRIADKGNNVHISEGMIVRVDLVEPSEDMRDSCDYITDFRFISGGQIKDFSREELKQILGFEEETTDVNE